MSDPTKPTQPSPNQHRISVNFESTERQNLLEAVTITDQGIAVCKNALTGTVMRLAAVRVTDSSSAASHIPFEHGDDGKVNFALPANKPSQIGFFVDHAGERAVSAAARIGDYPGTPLITAGALIKSEALINLAGIKHTENDEQLFASQIDLFNTLGFNPSKTRGIFSKAHSAGGGVWEEQRIVMLPKGTEDLLEDVTTEAASSTFQILGYETRRAMSLAPSRSSLLGYNSALDNLFGGPSQKLMMRADFTAGFGKSFETNHQTTSINIVSLQGAFAVHAVAMS